ncbi:hypothetical protein TGMAS_413010 [Toxoplasma gondii MAS]|uniref:Uncharacterized protein n=1 Tax=Toxoplasma gondii MAS TaxID=943118 RepID=A0A086QXD1_TOXGO|nr:hypothetical protein TGMAS_413010 [Toxoplasma gondii MAS]
MRSTRFTISFALRRDSRTAFSAKPTPLSASASAHRSSSRSSAPSALSPRSAHCSRTASCSFFSRTTCLSSSSTPPITCRKRICKLRRGAARATRPERRVSPPSAPARPCRTNSSSSAPAAAPSATRLWCSSVSRSSSLPWMTLTSGPVMSRILTEEACSFSRARWTCKRPSAATSAAVCARRRRLRSDGVNALRFFFHSSETPSSFFSTFLPSRMSRAVNAFPFDARPTFSPESCEGEPRTDGRQTRKSEE